MSKRIVHIFILFLFIPMLLCKCGMVNDTKETLSLIGEYQSTHSLLMNDGIDCNIELVSNEEFDLFKVVCNTQVNMTFYFNGTFEFTDIVLNYNTSIAGDWKYRNGVLDVNVDTTSFSYEFASSNAEEYVEQTMVRYLRKYVKESFLPQIKSMLINNMERSVNVISISDSVMIFSSPEQSEVHVLKRIN